MLLVVRVDLFSRYVFRQLAGSFLLILSTLTLIVWIATALSQLDLVTSQSQTFSLFLMMTSLALPNLLALIAPNALLISCLHTLDRLNGDSELIIMSGSGAPVWRLAAPFMALASLVAASLLIANLYLMPLSQRTLRDYITQVRTDLISQVLQPGRFSSPEKGLTFHIRDRALNGDLLGMMVHDERNNEQGMTYLARRGQLIRTEEEVSFLVMLDGHIHRPSSDKDVKDKAVQIVAFQQYVFDISEFGPKTEASTLKPRERYLSELLNPEPDDSYYKQFPGKFRSELHERFASLLYPFVFALVSLVFLGQPRTNRQERWTSIFIAFGVCVAVRVAGLGAMNLATLQVSGVVFMYAIPLGAILVAAMAAHARMKPVARFNWNFTLPAKLKFHNKISWTGRGMHTEQQRGRVG